MAFQDLLKMDLSISSDKASETSQKRKSNNLSPTPNIQKKYIWDEQSLLSQNKFYLLKPTEESTDVSTKTTQQQKHNKVPPIFLHNANNHNAIIEDITKIVSKEFITKYTSNYLRINLTDEADYRKLTKFYTENQLKFHTFHNPEESPLTVVVRNIPISLKEEEILNELKLTKLPVLKVVRLLNKHKKPLPLCYVDLTKSDEANEIYKLEKLFHSIVSVEPRRKSRDIPQCTRCQRYGHTKNYCQLEPRCVKCKGNHLYTQCLKSSDEPPVCVNCTEQHSANYKGCSYYQSMKSKLTRNHQHVSPQNQNPNSTTTAAITNENFPRHTATRPSMSYSEAARNQRTQNNQTNNNSHEQQSPISKMINIVIELLTPYLNQIKDFFLKNVIPLFLNGP